MSPSRKGRGRLLDDAAEAQPLEQRAREEPVEGLLPRGWRLSAWTKYRSTSATSRIPRASASSWSTRRLAAAANRMLAVLRGLVRGSRADGGQPRHLGRRWSSPSRRTYCSRSPGEATPTRRASHNPALRKGTAVPPRALGAGGSDRAFHGEARVLGDEGGGAFLREPQRYRGRAARRPEPSGEKVSRAHAVNSRGGARRGAHKCPRTYLRRHSPRFPATRDLLPRDTDVSTVIAGDISLNVPVLCDRPSPRRGWLVAIAFAGAT